MNRFLHRCLTRTPIIGLLTAALLFRALIPAGFMPAQNENGAIVMQLCSGFEAKSVVVDLGPDASTQHTNNQLFEHTPCGFTAAQVSAPPPAIAVFTGIASAGSPLIAAVRESVVAPSSRRAHAPRAPPLA